MSLRWFYDNLAYAPHNHAVTVVLYIYAYVYRVIIDNGSRTPSNILAERSSIKTKVFFSSDRLAVDTFTNIYFEILRTYNFGGVRICLCIFRPHT